MRLPKPKKLKYPDVVQGARGWVGVPNSLTDGATVRSFIDGWDSGFSSGYNKALQEVMEIQRSKKSRQKKARR